MDWLLCKENLPPQSADRCTYEKIVLEEHVYFLSFCILQNFYAKSHKTQHASGSFRRFPRTPSFNVAFLPPMHTPFLRTFPQPPLRLLPSGRQSFSSQSFLLLAVAAFRGSRRRLPCKDMVISFTSPASSSSSSPLANCEAILLEEEERETSWLLCK